MIQMFKAKYSIALSMHTDLIKRKDPFSEDEMQAFEIKNYGFDLKKIGSTSTTSLFGF